MKGDVKKKVSLKPAPIDFLAASPVGSDPKIPIAYFFALHRQRVTALLTVSPSIEITQSAAAVSNFTNSNSDCEQMELNREH